MQKKLTITVDDEVYRCPHEQAGHGHITGSVEELVRPHLVLLADLEEGYRAMAADAERERDAVEWAEGLLDLNSR